MSRRTSTCRWWSLRALEVLRHQRPEFLHQGGHRHTCPVLTHRFDAANGCNVGGEPTAFRKRVKEIGFCRQRDTGSFMRRDSKAGEALLVAMIAQRLSVQRLSALICSSSRNQSSTPSPPPQGRSSSRTRTSGNGSLSNRPRHSRLSRTVSTVKPFPPSPSSQVSSHSKSASAISTLQLKGPLPFIRLDLLLLSTR